MAWSARSAALASGLVVLVACVACTSGGSTSAAKSASSSTSTTAGSSTAAGTAKSSTKPLPTTAVPAPTPGNIKSTVPARTVTTNKPVSLQSSTTFGGGVGVKLTKISAIQAKAQLPGEVAGPALEIAVQLTNDSAKSINVNDVVLNVYDSSQAPGVQMSASPSAPFTGSLAAHKTATATYVFTVPTDRRSPVTVSITFTATAPVVLFTGNV